MVKEKEKKFKQKFAWMDEWEDKDDIDWDKFDRKVLRALALCSLCFVHSDALTSSLESFELYKAINQRKQCVVAAQTDVGPWMNLSAALADQDVASTHILSVKALYATTLCIRIPTVPGTTLAFFM